LPIWMILLSSDVLSRSTCSICRKYSDGEGVSGYHMGHQGTKALPERVSIRGDNRPPRLEMAQLNR